VTTLEVRTDDLDEVRATYLSVLDGTADPATGHLLTMR
jgi:hypothetical protein